MHHIEALYEVQKRRRPKSYRQLKRELGLDVTSLVNVLEDVQEAVVLPASEPTAYEGYDAPTALVVRTGQLTDIYKTIPIRGVAKG